MKTMHGLRNSRGLGRLLAAWLLLSFIAMAATPLPPLAAGQGVRLAAAAAGPHEQRATHVHEGHHGGLHATPVPQAQDGAGAGTHGGHAAGSVVHCPLCLHAAAPPQAAPAQPSVGDAPGLQVAAAGSAAVRVRSDAPPPGRGPPAPS